MTNELKNAFIGGDDRSTTARANTFAFFLTELSDGETTFVGMSKNCGRHLISRKTAIDLIEILQEYVELIDDETVQKLNEEADKEELERESIALQEQRTKIKKPTASGYVYLIHAEGTDRYKIGVSKKPIYRLSQLQKQSPYTLNIIHTIFSNDPYELEANLHLDYELYHINGEWFNLPAEVIENFKQIEVAI